jgi:hypothetical protein
LKKRKKRGRLMFISALLCMMMVFSLNPVSTLAEGEGVVGTASAAATEDAGEKGTTQADNKTESTVPQAEEMDGDAQS